MILCDCFFINYSVIIYDYLCTVLQNSLTNVFFAVTLTRLHFSSHLVRLISATPNDIMNTPGGYLTTFLLLKLFAHITYNSIYNTPAQVRWFLSFSANFYSINFIQLYMFSSEKQTVATCSARVVPSAFSSMEMLNKLLEWFQCSRVWSASMSFELKRMRTIVISWLNLY